MKLFVYGTLKRGFGNHAVLRGAEFIGKASLQGFEMYSLGGFPGIIPVTGFSWVEGELYEVSDFLHLDRLEGYNPETKRGMYLREEVSVVPENSEEPVACEVYVWNREVIGRTLITDGVWR